MSFTQSLKFLVETSRMKEVVTFLLFHFRQRQRQDTTQRRHKNKLLENKSIFYLYHMIIDKNDTKYFGKQFVGVSNVRTLVCGLTN